MELNTTLPWFSLLVLAVGLMRLLELRVSTARRQALMQKGVPPVYEPHFREMVLFHAFMLFGSAAEAWMSNRPLYPAVAVPAFVLLVGANVLRWWVIATLGPHWNVRIMNSTPLGVVATGPFRWIRHPNYVAVFLELFALPLCHSAWVTAFVGAGIHVWVLYHRVNAEESVLLADETYRRVMGDKPRFLPRLRLPEAPR